MKFDFIVGNPPYNGKKPSEGSLYAVIWSKALIHLKKGGQSASIHPIGWRTNEEGSKLLTNIYKKGTVKAKLHNTLFSRYIWNVVANVDEVIFTNNDKHTVLVKFENNRKTGDFIDVTDFFKDNPIPTMYFEIFKELLDFSYSKKKIKFIKPLKTSKKYSLKKEKDKIFKYPVIHKIMKPKKIKEGIWFTSSLSEFDNRPKIIMSWGSLHNMLDLKGEYQAVSDRNLFIFGEKEELKNLYRILDFLPFKLFMQSITGSDQRVLYDQYSKKIKILEMFSTDFGDKFFELYKKYDLNEDYFYHSVSEIKKIGEYKDYVNHAKLGSTWNENKRIKKETQYD